LGMVSRRMNNFPESGRGLGHVTPTIFGSTVGYPSDSLASCSNGALADPYDLPFPHGGYICPQDTRMAISLKRVILSTSCLVLG